MEFVATSADGAAISYVDRKRFGWLVAFISPLLGVSTVLSYFVTNESAWTLFLPLIYAFVLIPLIDSILGEDTHNPPDAVVPLLAQDSYYRILLYVDVCLLYGSFLVGIWFVGAHAVPWWAYLGFALGSGITSADAIFVGHELGHKKSKVDRVGAQIALALIGYGHFTIEHNRGHHVQVATPEDSASSRMGETVYRFVVREIPGALKRSWRLETMRLASSGHQSWSWRNEILQSWAVTATVAIGATAVFGWSVLPFIVIHHLYAWYGLTQANYVEHYGLLREKLPNGRYEVPQPKHSWNTNHVFSNLVTFHLQRHSDHHANALRPYQALRDFEGLPRLPSGYPGCFGLAMIPATWFKVMDPKLLEWCNGDMNKLNIDPRRRADLVAKYGSSKRDVSDELVGEPIAIQSSLVSAFADALVLDLDVSDELSMPAADLIAASDRGLRVESAFK
jgi:alkane 1-monooxygenase